MDEEGRKNLWNRECCLKPVRAHYNDDERPMAAFGLPLIELERKNESMISDGAEAANEWGDFIFLIAISIIVISDHVEVLKTCANVLLVVDVEECWRFLDFSPEFHSVSHAHTREGQPGDQKFSTWQVTKTYDDDDRVVGRERGSRKSFVTRHALFMLISKGFPSSNSHARAVNEVVSAPASLSDRLSLERAQNP